jgi:hypothetical protein
LWELALHLLHHLDRRVRRVTEREQNLEFACIILPEKAPQVVGKPIVDAGQRLQNADRWGKLQLAAASARPRYRRAAMMTSRQ